MSKKVICIDTCFRLSTIVCCIDCDKRGICTTICENAVDTTREGIIETCDCFRFDRELKSTICTSSKGWSGTRGKTYSIENIKFLSKKDVRFKGDIINWKAYTVVDDNGSRIDIPSNFFKDPDLIY